MNLDALGMLSVTTVVTIVQAIFWRWVSSVSDNSKDNAKKLEDMKTDISGFKLDVSQNYQSKAEAHRDMQTIMDGLKEIKVEVKEVGNKLDKKADKT